MSRWSLFDIILQGWYNDNINLIVGYKEAAVRLSEEEERLLQDSERIVQAEVNFQFVN